MREREIIYRSEEFDSDLLNHWLDVDSELEAWLVPLQVSAVGLSLDKATFLIVSHICFDRPIGSVTIDFTGKLEVYVKNKVIYGEIEELSDAIHRAVAIWQEGSLHHIKRVGGC